MEMERDECDIENFQKIFPTIIHALGVQKKIIYDGHK